MGAHVVKWLGPSPLWKGVGAESDALFAPALLRFASDSFMEEFLALLERHPESVAELKVGHETWRTPLGTAKKLDAPITVEREPRRVRDYARFKLQQARQTLAPVSPPQSEKDEPYRLKLYQPAHQRYYLVASSLVCAQPGFP